MHFLSDLNWQAIAGESESPEVKAAQAELEVVLGEIDRTTGKLNGLQALVDEGSFSKSLFDELDRQKAVLGDYTSRRDNIAATLAGARQKAASLHAPEELIEAIRSGNPELRLKLKNEIRKRIASIDLAFGYEGFDVMAEIKFIKGASTIRGFVFRGEEIWFVRGEGQI